jgi:hypothetical protein
LKLNEHERVPNAELANPLIPAVFAVFVECRDAFFVPTGCAAICTAFAATPEAFLATHLTFAQRAFIAAEILARPRQTSCGEAEPSPWMVALRGVYCPSHSQSGDRSLPPELCSVNFIPNIGNVAIL